MAAAAAAPATEDGEAIRTGHFAPVSGPVEPIALLQRIERTRAAFEAFRRQALDPPTGTEKAAEWLLDNDYHVARALREIAKGLPPAYLAKLPGAQAERVHPRPYVIARDYFLASHMQLSFGEFESFIESVQKSWPLSLAELWALPNMLRITAVETLLGALGELFGGEGARLLDGWLAPASPASVHAIERVARAITVLRTIAEISWGDFVDAVSIVERTLQGDPALAYPRMDFATRDRYRGALEQIADDAGRSEQDVAQDIIGLTADAHDPVERHVGYWLVDRGRAALEARLGAKLPWTRRAGRAVLAHPWALYAGLGLGGWIGFMLPPALFLYLAGASTAGWIGGLLLAVIPASILAMVLLNGLLTRLLPPRVLPKMDFTEGLPASAKTAVVVPVILAPKDDRAALARVLEQHWLANADRHLSIVLLADLADAKLHSKHGDTAIIAGLTAEIEQLNRRYASEGHEPFHLLLRPRQYNPAEERWMAWERKRGKLEQFNDLVLTGERGAFDVAVGATEALQEVRYVVTLDADTMLPSGSVARLAATIDHPLNRPRIDPATRLPQRGHAIIQPRIEISPQSGERSRFARLFTGDTAIDIYSRAVSDVYQDLFGWGAFVGKGIYEVEAFHACLAGRVPENAILSHDLFEGAFCRAALATDIVLYENFPGSYPEYSRRLHRWTRGDWQLLPWLAPRVPVAGGQREANRFHSVDRWKLLDNLRRSLVAPSLLALAIAGWLILPGSALAWTLLVIFAHSGQLLIELATGMGGGRRKGTVHGLAARLEDHAGRALLAIVFLCHEALVSAHAIALTLWRLLVTRQHLLQWTTAAAVARAQGAAGARGRSWREMWPASLFALAIALAMLRLRPEALPVAAILLLPWMLAPEIARWLVRPAPSDKRDIDAGGRAYLRLLARRTWLFFETFAGPADHWLPPDNYQGPPFEEIAHRTSPTNIGMLLTSTATAWDQGFIGRAELEARSENLLDTLGRLERYHGHFYNWYNTRDLQPLEPRYVSVVDSGNLAVAMIAYAAALREAAQSAALEPQRWQGLSDLLVLVAEAAAAFDEGELLACQAQSLARAIADIELRESDPCARFASEWRQAVGRLVAAGERLLAEDTTGDLARRADLRAWVDRLDHHLRELARDADIEMPHATRLTELARVYERLAWAMQFGWLYDGHRDLLYLGYNASLGRIDTHHYDLLASEARLASLLAIAKRDLPVRHWFHLGRPVVRRARDLLLQSWNGSMFEYLMPRLFLPSEPNTLVGRSEAAAAALQRRYGERHGLPWGVSESAYALRDAENRFQYRAFGVPDLGMRRGLAEDTVIAPYASALALAVDPPGAVANLQALDALGAGSRFGLFEAVDFTPGRVPADRQFAPVNAAMAHHQGMVMGAIGNALCADIHARRFMEHPRIATVALLLSERVPHELPSEIGRLEAERAGNERLTSARSAVRWAPQARPWPQGVLLTNGRLSSWISDRGPAALRWQRFAINRFPADPLADSAGPAFYVKDRETQRLLALGAGGGAIEADTASVTFAANGAEFHASEAGLEINLEVALAQDHDLEIRRVTLRNESAHDRNLLLSWYAEPVLSRPIEDERHPAFNRLFVAGRFVDAPAGLLFTRRPRTPEETPPAVFYMLVDDNGPARDLAWSTDRRAFLGRNRDLRDPQGAHRPLAPDDLSGLDAACVLQTECRLHPGEERQFHLVTIVGGSADTVQSVAQTLRTPAAIDWLLHQGRAGCGLVRGSQGFDDADLVAAQELGMLLAFGHPALVRRDPGAGGDGAMQSDLWGCGISGDLPIVLLEVEGEGEDLPATLVRAHRLWRLAGLETDLVLLQTAGSGYLEPLREQLSTMLHAAGSAGALGARGGVHLLFADQLGEDRTAQLKGAAAACLVEREGSLRDQLERAASAAHLPIPPIIASRAPAGEIEFFARPQATANAAFELGDKACAISLDPGSATPAPWANVLANPEFGTLVTEAGGGFTWSVNSGEHRLTSWTNDPVADRVSEALYLRDEETTQVWSIAPAPCGPASSCEVDHAQGHSRWRRSSHGLDQTMTVTVPPDDTVKLIRIAIANRTDRPRRLTATYYVEWLLGALASTDRRHIRCEFAAPAALLATNRWREDFAERVAFLAASRPPHGYCVDRGEFFGEDGDPARPDALRRWGLRNGIPASYDPCGAYQVHLDLAPGEATELCFVLGDAAGRGQALAKVARWTGPDMAEAALAEASDYWDDLAGALQVQTPDRALDLMINRWLPYQALSSRVFGRCGFYQASGAYGFRDQLQDVLAFLHARPALAREQILRCARHQFEQGDVLHWWHPPADRGVRTRFSDDLHWLAYAVGSYVQATGDESILTEEVDFLAAPPLGDDESDRYDRFPLAGNPAPVIEHCERALERIVTGVHGLPLIGAGDWNDGMDRLGIAGRGESVWLAWFVAEVMELHADMLRRLDRGDQARHWRDRAAAIRSAAREQGWDGAWFRRAYDDRGKALGAAGNAQCAIDSIAQSWARFALGDDPRAARALDSAWEHLVDQDAALARLLWPPFQIDESDPGYIASYPPGVRENGGQYNHAAAWLGLAFAAAGDGDRAHRVFSMISPAHRTADDAASEGYRIEPYCVAGDIATHGARRGRGGWSWYTGAAAWGWRLAVEGILGLRLEEGRLALAPCLPRDWPGFTARLTRDGGTIEVTVEVGACASPAMRIDGKEVPWSAVAFPEAGRTRAVTVQLPGTPRGAPSPALADMVRGAG